MTTEITELSLGDMEYCEVRNHSKVQSFQGTGHIGAALVENNIQLSIWVRGTTPDKNTTVTVDLDRKAMTALIGQMKTMKAVLVERLEANHVA